MHITAKKHYILIFLGKILTADLLIYPLKTPVKKFILRRLKLRRDILFPKNKRIQYFLATKYILYTEVNKSENFWPLFSYLY